MPTPTLSVLNMRDVTRTGGLQPYHAYVGRSHGPHHFGNPFTHRRAGQTLASCVVDTRDEAISAYAQWLDGTAHTTVEPQRRQWILDNLHTLRGKDLVCWCAPLPCHADILLTLANTP